METVRDADPQTVRELSRSARPLEVREGDFTLGGQRVRVLLVIMVSEDQNSTHKLVRVLGPATGEESLIIPCGEGVEMAHIDDIVLAAKEKRRARAQASALWLPERQEQVNGALGRLAENEMARRRGQSSFGSAVTIQRSSS